MIAHRTRYSKPTYPLYSTHQNTTRPRSATTFYSTNSIDIKYSHTRVHTYDTSIFVIVQKKRELSLWFLFTMRSDPTALRHLLQRVFVSFCKNLIKTLKGHIWEWLALLFFFFFFYIFIYKYLLTPSPFFTHSAINKNKLIETAIHKVSQLLTSKFFFRIFRHVPWTTDHQWSRRKP